MKFRKVEKIALRLGIRNGYLKVVFSLFRFCMQVASALPKKSTGKRFVIFAMPKSGSTFLENVVTHFSGRVSVMHPYVNLLEKRHAHSMLSRHVPALWVYKFACFSKYHLLPTAEAIERLNRRGIQVILLNRNLDEVIKSFLNYVEVVEHHPMHKTYSGKSMQERMEIFDRTDREHFENFQKYYDLAENSEGVMKLSSSELRNAPEKTVKRLLDFLSIETTDLKSGLETVKNEKENLTIKHILN